MSLNRERNPLAGADNASRDVFRLVLRAVNHDRNLMLKVYNRLRADATTLAAELRKQAAQLTRKGKCHKSKAERNHVIAKLRAQGIPPTAIADKLIAGHPSLVGEYLPASKANRRRLADAVRKHLAKK